jgi:hypothetical protein
MFDWPKFLDQYSIPYVTSGANVSKGNLATKCPFCGMEDDSHHMSISLTGKGWRCWRRPDLHRGKSPIKLVQAFLHCSYEHAARLIGIKQHFIPTDFMSQVEQCLNPKKPPRPEALHLPPQFREFNPQLYSCKPFIKYLKGRHFPDKVLDEELRYCSTGAFKGRLVFPIYDDHKHLVSWTGRTIYPGVELRYKTLSPVPEKAQAEGLKPALGPINHYLLYQDQLLRNKTDSTICICEGPMDALKVRVLGRGLGIAATALFTAMASVHQIDLLHEILPRYERRLIILDANTLPTALRLQNLLSGLGVEVISVPEQLKDPGALRSRSELLSLIQLT